MILDFNFCDRIYVNVRVAQIVKLEIEPLEDRGALRKKEEGKRNSIHMTSNHNKDKGGGRREQRPRGSGRSNKEDGPMRSKYV